MNNSRRKFLTGSAVAAAGLFTTSLARPTTIFGAAPGSKLAGEVIRLFESLPGIKAVKIWAPAKNRGQEFLATLNPGRQMFCASSFKGFVLCEALRQIDSPQLIGTLNATQLALDASVWSLGSSILNPPNLSGLLTERTTLEAMITHSDNTATDMTLKHVGADRVRDFVQSIGLRNTRIPNSTRQFLGYIFGSTDWRNTTWDEIVSFIESNAPAIHPLLNDVQTMASSPDDFVSFYSRALQGAFFNNPATLAEFRRILSMPDTISRVVPLGANGFLKAGSVDAGGSHGLSIAGGMYFPDRWVYFATIINWQKPGDSDPETAVAFGEATRQALTLVAEALGR
jgi:beta-lactamase class A